MAEDERCRNRAYVEVEAKYSIHLALPGLTRALRRSILDPDDRIASPAPHLAARSGHPLQILSRLLYNNHVCADGNRCFTGALICFLQRGRIQQRPVPQDLDPEWSLPPLLSILNCPLTLTPCPPESLVPDGTHPPSGTLEQDLDKLGDILEESVPAYILVRLDDPPTEWLAVHYVPDSAKVRDKVCTLCLYVCLNVNLTVATDAVCCNPEYVDQKSRVDALCRSNLCYRQGRCQRGGVCEA